MDETPEGLRVVCGACDGDGHVPVPNLALINGTPQTVFSARKCRWCDGRGFRVGMQPPV